MAQPRFPSNSSNAVFLSLYPIVSFYAENSARSQMDVFVVSQFRLLVRLLSSATEKWRGGLATHTIVLISFLPPAPSITIVRVTVRIRFTEWACRATYCGLANHALSFHLSSPIVAVLCVL